MRTITHHPLVISVLLIALGMPAGCFAADTDEAPSPPLLADMVAPAEIASMVISPDGKYIAGTGNTDWKPVVFVMDTEHFKSRVLDMPPTSTRFQWRWPQRVSWAADDLLAIDFSSEQSEAVDLNGQRVAKLGERFIRRMRDKGAAGDWVLAYNDLRSGAIDLVNARSGERRTYRIALPGRPLQWAFDDAGRLRAVTMQDTAFWTAQTRISNWYRADEQSPWQLLEDWPVTADRWVPLRVLPEPGMLAVLSRHERDTWAVFRYDTATRQHVRLMAGNADEDVLGATGPDDTTFDSVVTNGLKPHRDWFDVRWARIQASVDAELPGSVNTLSGNPEGLMLIASYSDVDPGRWFLLDTRSMTLRNLAQVSAAIDPKRMRPMQTMQYTARDGLRVSAYLTRTARPKGGPAPLVVLIHGGPNVRDQWSWNEEVQVLAGQGYTVFQPQFRGSAGFGRHFEEAGFQQWGLAMQDDITDGVKTLVEQGVADPARICIYGASYGGYAALWGVIKTPALYKCGVSFAGVSDLGAWASHSVFDDSDAISREFHRQRIGDPARMRAQLDAVSSLKHAAQVQVPLLIAHGEEDTRVLPSQSTDMVAALRKAGKTVEWIPYPGEGHGLYWRGNRMSYYAALLSFLERHIGETAGPAAASTALKPAP